MKYWSLLTACVALSLLGACDKQDDAPPFDAEPVIQAYLADSAITDAQRTESGLYYVIEEPGSGVQPTVDSLVRFTWTARLTDGTVVSSPAAATTPTIGTLGDFEIEAWTEGLQLIGPGGKIRLISPPDLAFGTAGSPPVGADEVVIFDLELLGFTPDSREIIDAYLAETGIDSAQTTASGLTYIIHEPGGDEHPTPSSQVRVQYVGTFLDGEEFDSSNGAAASFRLDGLIEAWKEGIPLIGEGGRITLITPYELAYGAGGNRSIPPYSVLRFDITLDSFTGQ